MLKFINFNFFHPFVIISTIRKYFYICFEIPEFMNKLIGFHKELETDEDIKIETPNFTYVYGKNSSLLGSDMVAKIYLTNKKLLFLTFTEFSDKVPLNNWQKEALAFRGSKKATNALTQFMENFSNNIGNAQKSFVELLTQGKVTKHVSLIWFELPLEGMDRVQASGKEVVIKYEKHKKNWVDIFRGKPEVSFLVETPDVWRIHLEGFMKKQKGNDLNCPRCGTNYQSGTVKFVDCSGCGEKVCREREVKSMFRKSWETTNCFDDDEYSCRKCLKKK